jgi:hypothetical protein
MTRPAEIPTLRALAPKKIHKISNRNVAEWRYRFENKICQLDRVGRESTGAYVSRSGQLRDYRVRQTCSRIRGGLSLKKLQPALGSHKFGVSARSGSILMKQVRDGWLFARETFRRRWKNAGTITELGPAPELSLMPTSVEICIQKSGGIPGINNARSHKFRRGE